MPHSIGHFCRKLCQLLCVTASLMVLGCKSQPNAGGGYDEIVSVRSTNHTPYNITEFYVDGVWAGGSPALGVGSGTVCCAVKIPQQWREGLTAKVRWTHSQAINDAHGKPIGETVWYESDAPILPYQNWNVADVHFFPDGTAKIVVLSPENVSQPPIADPVRPKGWENNPVEYYCKVVKLNGMSEKKCRELTFESYYGSSR